MIWKFFGFCWELPGRHSMWCLFYAFIIVPRDLRDWVYDLVAGRRYRWFGRREECMIPTPELKERFLS